WSSPSLAEADGEIVHRLERVGVLLAQRPPAHLHHLLRQLQRFRSSPALAEIDGKIVHRVERVCVLLDQRPPARLHHLLCQPQRFRPLTALAIYKRKFLYHHQTLFGFIMYAKDATSKDSITGIKVRYQRSSESIIR